MKKKIGIFVENRKTDGGSYTQSEIAIKQFIRLFSNNYKIEVIYSEKINFNKNSSYLINKLINKLLCFNLFRFFFFSFKFQTKLEKFFEKKKYHLIYFPEPTLTCLQLNKISFITTIWDIGHLQFKNKFIEMKNNFYLREKLYKFIVNKCLLLILDTPQLMHLVKKNYKINNKKIILLPFVPSDKQVKKKFFIKTSKNFFFYPSNYWNHKNHIIILKSCIFLKKDKKKFNFIFTGEDKGNLKNLKKFAKKNKITDMVSFLGFQKKKQIINLYKTCKAVVVPTYLGPSNLPPLEAWQYSKPVIYPNHLSFFTKSASITFKVDNPKSLIRSLNKTYSKKIYNNMIFKGHKALNNIYKDRALKENKFKIKLIKKLDAI